jgi:hypothetical protein
MNDRIDEYLDELLERLDGSGSERRLMLSEAEAHLREAAAEYERGGLKADAAQRQAIVDFGSATVIAKSSNHRGARAVVGAYLVAAAQLCTAGFAAIGVGALVARGLALFTSIGWVYGAPATRRFASDTCAHFLKVQPGAADCSAAAAMENSQDAFLFMVGSAILGLVIVGLVMVGIRVVRRRSRVPAQRLPRNIVNAVGATAFLIVGLALGVAAASNGSMNGVWGQGMLVADSAVSLAVGFVFLARLLLDTRPGAVAA